MVKDRESMKGVNSWGPLPRAKARPRANGPFAPPESMIGGQRLGRLGRIGRVGTPNTSWAERFNTISNSIPGLEPTPLFELEPGKW